LRYLWARHRIALLSDYNNLAQNDERIKEITSLGLTYNLLTAYTSFIAVDSEVRLKDGQATTVRQPLPLPEGVSDYAVGGYAAPQYPQRMSMPAQKTKGEALYSLMPAAEEMEPPMAKSVMIKDEAKRLIQSGRVELGTITISGGLQQTSVKQILEQHSKAINQCVQKVLPKQPSPPGEISIIFIVDSKGDVVNVRIDKSELQNEEVEQCILKTIEQLTFPAPTDGKEATVTVSFHLKA